MKEVTEIDQRNEMENENENQKLKLSAKRIIKIIILIILIIIVIITSFKTGKRFFEIKNTNFDDSYSKVDSCIAYWYFDAEIRLNERSN